FCALVRSHNIAFHEKKLGQLFCDHSAQDIIDMLKKECARYHVHILPGCNATKIIKKDGFRVTTPQGEYRCQSLVVASGGLSIPPLGATDFGYRLARQFGLNIVPCRPGLVPLTWSAKDLSLFKSLSGVSVPAEVRTGNKTFAEYVLFTHKGLSGPAILQISSYWEPGSLIEINLLPGRDIVALFENGRHKKTLLKNFLADFLPSRLAEILCAHFVPNKPLNQYTDKEFRHIAAILGQWTVIPKGTEGYAKAEVTVGGIDTDELSSKTMGARKVPGLYFIGEVVDVTGQLGGFNFQWAWSSGFAAGQHA
ncbi:MAG: NAD(P)/FAD-dependent oxidoreductase, partial [Candidatus Omnitrophica bacterium]|nr:NAD(P)/FAD-dependent oxidoreductase [Candidatus Omnitrophota bacterium]